MCISSTIRNSFLLRHIRLTVILVYNILSAFVLLIFWKLIPALLSYPPNFNEVSNQLGTSTVLQYVAVYLFSAVVSTIVFSRILKGMDDLNNLTTKDQENVQKISEIRRKCLDLPYLIFWGQIIIFNIPIILLVILMPILNKLSMTISLKMMLVCFAFSFTFSVLLYTVYREIFKAILLKTSVGTHNEGLRITLKGRIFIQIIPLIIVSILITSLLGYSRLIVEKDDFIYDLYKMQIIDLLKNTKSIKDATHTMQLLKGLNCENTQPIYFVETPDKKLVTSNHSSLSEYLTYYIQNPYNGDRIFDLDMSTQGIVIKLTTENEGVIRAGVVFKVVSENTSLFFLISFLSLLLLNILFLYHMCKTLSSEISEVSEGLIEIAESENINQHQKLSVTSNDEIGDLVIAFNKIRKRHHEYDNLKNEFIGNISHELRTPLNVILATLQLFDLNLKRDHTINVEKSTKNIKMMKQNCYRLLRLINNLIDTSKIDGGFSDLQLQPLDIIKFIEEITSSVTEYARMKGIDLKFAANVPEKIIYCDSDKMEKVMLNLLSNAIKFTNTGGTIDVAIYDKEETILISVKDSGIGIPDAKQKIVFERFRQTEQSLARSYEGSGIGLSLAKSLIEMHGGKIRVESEEGVGSDFIVELPVNFNNFPEEMYLQTDYQDKVISSSNVEKINIELSDIYQ